MRKIIFLILIISTIIIAQQRDSSIIFVSDTQAPMWIETLRLPEHDNKKATKLIYHAIEQESTAVAVFHLGDITSIGMMDSYWKPFDEFRKHLRVPLYSIIGNHEYFFFKKPALEQFHNRFPSVTTTWYSVVTHSVAIIALNSNLSQLSGHAHAYEHFQNNGKEFLVIGGGGGLLQPLLTGSEQRFTDLFSRDQSLRFFHYIECRIEKELLRFSVKKLRSDRAGFDAVDSISVRFQ